MVLCNLKNRPKGASLSINENIQKRVIEKKIATMLKKNEFLYSEIAKEKEYINNLLFPSYDLNLILEPETEENPISISKNTINSMKSKNLEKKIDDFCKFFQK